MSAVPKPTQEPQESKVEIQTETPKPKPRKRRKNYLNNADMMVAVRESLEKDEMTPTFTNMMIMLTDRYAKQPNFSSYSYLDDMKAYALYMICRTWTRFNPERSSNPFAFFTQCIKHSFYQFLNKEKKQRNIRDELLVDSGLNPSNTYMVEYEQEQWEQHNDTTDEGSDGLNESEADTSAISGTG